MGLGIAVSQIAMAGRDEDLFQVLPEIDLPHLGTWIVTHENLRRLPRIAAVFAHLVTEFDAYGRDVE